MLIMLLSAFLASVSQILLKLSAKGEHKNRLFEYLNPKVIIGYGLLFLTMVMNIWAYQNMEYHFGPVINSFTYVFVLALSVLFLKEKLTRNKVIGVILIVAGVCVSALL